MVTARRRDPLRCFQFRLKLFDQPAPPQNFSGEGEAEPGAPSDYIAGVSRVSGLSATVSSTEIWSGGNMLHRHAHPDRCTWDAITLEQGLALDSTLAHWANAAIDFAARGVVGTTGPVKRGLILDVWDPYVVEPPQAVGGEPLEGWAPQHPMYRYLIHNAWISRYQAMPGLDSRSNEAALLSVEITHEGWMTTGVAPTPGILGDPTNQPGFPDLLDTIEDTDTAIA